MQRVPDGSNKCQLSSQVKTLNLHCGFVFTFFHSQAHQHQRHHPPNLTEIWCSCTGTSTSKTLFTNLHRGTYVGTPTSETPSTKSHTDSYAGTPTSETPSTKSHRATYVDTPTSKTPSTKFHRGSCAGDTIFQVSQRNTCRHPNI